MTPRRVLVLGASGFIGRRIVAALAAHEGVTPIAGRHRSAVGDGAVSTVQVDATSRDALVQAMEGIDVVVNAVLGSAETIESSTQALIEAARAASSAPRLVHLSTMSVYGSSEGVVTEGSPLKPDIGPYSQAKVAAERLLQAYPRRVVLRPGIVYGPGGVQWSLRIAQLLRQRRLGDLGPDGDGYANLVHVGDVGRAVLAASLADELDGETFNLGSPQPPTWNEYFIAFAQALGATPVHTVPAWAMRMERALGLPLEASHRIGAKLGLGGLPNGLTPALLRLWRQRIVLDVRHAEQRLGMRWIPLEDGLRGTSAALQSATRR